MNTVPPLDQEKLLYKLVIQFLIFCQGSHKLLEPHLAQIGKRLKSGASLNDLTPELQSVSKTLLHISKQTESGKEEDNTSEKNAYLLQRLDELLAKSYVPVRFEQQKSALRQKIKNNTDDQNFNHVIDSAIALLIDIKEFAVSEQNHIEGFLAELTNQLGAIEQHAEIVGQSNQLSMDHREALNSKINTEVNIPRQSRGLYGVNRSKR